MNQIAAIDNSKLLSVLSNNLYPGAKQESVLMVIEYCKQAGLDPMQKPVHIVPMWDSKLGAMRDVVMPGIGLYRIQASRSGEYGGVSEPEFGPDVAENIGGVDITYPKWCKVTVSRISGDKFIPFTAMEFWKENYAVKGGKEKSIAPNAMWTKRAYGQLAKCAEAQAQRKAFPEFCAGHTAEEMEGKYINGEPEIIDVSDDVSSIKSAQTMQQLQEAFTAAWKSNPDKNARARLTQAKDARKSELATGEIIEGESHAE